MSRRRKDLQGIDISRWPTVDTNALAPEMRDAFCNRRRAIELYGDGETVRKIEAQTGINSHQLYHLFDRCLKESEDGTIYGFRGLLKRKRLGIFKRTATIRVVDPESGSGLAGAFFLLIERYPTLATWLRRQIRDHAVVLTQLSTERGLLSNEVKMQPPSELRLAGRMRIRKPCGCAFTAITIDQNLQLLVNLN